MRNEILHAAGGALAGAIGTAVIKKELALSHKLPEKLRPAGPSQDPAHFMVSKVGKRARRPVPQKTLKAAEKALPLLYGMSFGALFGLLRSGRGRRLGVTGALAGGAALGTIVWAAGYLGWLPAVGLSKPVHEQGVGALTSLAAHLGYGLAVAIPFAAAEGLLKR